MNLLCDQHVLAVYGTDNAGSQHSQRTTRGSRNLMPDEDLEWEDVEGDDWDCLLQGDDLIEESNGGIRIEITVEGQCLRKPMYRFNLHCARERS